MNKRNVPEVKLPGIHIPYDDMPSGAYSSFGSALNGYTSPLTTIREFKMMGLMNAITDKADWREKVPWAFQPLHIDRWTHCHHVYQVFNDQIKEKWKKEAIESDGALTEAMVDWCIDELRYKTPNFEATGIVTAYDADVVKSDTAVPQDLKEALRSAVKPLEDVPTAEKDWHPGSDEKVLDLVHPSLFPLVYGLSRYLPDSVVDLDDCLDRCGEGNTLNHIQDDENVESGGPGGDNAFSKKFQWLPCDVDISGDVPKITSYINNLHPHRHKDLYAIVERIIGCAIPLWNATLTPQKGPIHRDLRIAYKGVEKLVPHLPEQREDEDSDDYWDRYSEWLDAAEPGQPDVGFFTPIEYPPNMLDEEGALIPKHIVDLKKEYADRGLQVIVKLANIHLTPEKPEYEGGTWHIEGQMNERICATAIYYYDSENVAQSSLGFRQTVSTEDADDISYEQNYHRWLSVIFGCNNEEAAIQSIGSVDTREGRLLSFPNILQHQVQPFKLSDPARPGHRKILALFLVDPNIKIISTTNIPCQRLDWWREVLEAKETGLGRLPLELKDHVYGQVEGFPMSMQTAKELRLVLMEERKNYTAGFEDTLETFSLCEH